MIRRLTEKTTTNKIDIKQKGKSALTAGAESLLRGRLRRGLSTYY